MSRWKVATAQLWHAEPAFALLVYFLVAVAQTCYMHLAGWGFHHGNGVRKLGLTVGAVGPSAGALVAFAVAAWRMWVGGYICWTASVLWALLSAVVSIRSLLQSASPFVIGLLVFSVASLVVLFTPAVLRRVDHFAGDTVARRDGNSASRVMLGT